MSESLDVALKQWCTEAHPLVGQPLVSPGGSVKDKWAELEKVISGNVGGSLLGVEGWNKQKTLIEDAIAKRELDPSDLSVEGDPIQKAIDLGTKIVKGREIVALARPLGVKTAGLKTLLSSKTGKDEVTELGKIDTLWKQAHKTVSDYVGGVFGMAEDPVYLKALEKAPTEAAFKDDMAIANVAGARSKADDYATWWPQTKAALDKLRKLKGDYGDGAQHIDPETWYDLATTSNNIDRLAKEVGEELNKANKALATGKSKTPRTSVESAERALKREVDAWNKVKVSSIDDKQAAGKTALDALTDLLITAQALAVVEPPLSTNPLYATLTNHITGRYDFFASLPSSWDRLDNRGVDCAPTVTDFLRDNFKLGMGIRVSGRVYTVCASNTSSAGLAFHTPIPAKLLIPQRPNVQSFVYHF